MGAEIEELKERSTGKDFEFRNIELRGEMAALEASYKNQVDNAEKIVFEKDLEIKAGQAKIQELEKENELLRKYYKLDEDPPDEIKMKIHIDLEINRLKEENLKLIIMRGQMPYFPMPYPYYCSFGGGGLRSAIQGKR